MVVRSRQRQTHKSTLTEGNTFLQDVRGQQANKVRILTYNCRCCKRFFGHPDELLDVFSNSLQFNSWTYFYRAEARVPFLTPVPLLAACLSMAHLHARCMKLHRKEKGKNVGHSQWDILPRRRKRWCGSVNNARLITCVCVAVIHPFALMSIISVGWVIVAGCSNHWHRSFCRPSLQLPLPPSCPSRSPPWSPAPHALLTSRRHHCSISPINCCFLLIHYLHITPRIHCCCI